MSSKNTELGLEENIEGALCYLLGFLSGIAFYLLEKDNKYVRFHAMQSTVVFGALFIVSIIVNSIASGIGGAMFFMNSFLAGAFIGIISLINTLIALLGFILWVLLMFKAYNGEKYKLPVLGDISEDFLK